MRLIDSNDTRNYRRQRHLYLALSLALGSSPACDQTPEAVKINTSSEAVVEPALITNEGSGLVRDIVKIPITIFDAKTGIALGADYDVNNQSTKIYASDNGDTEQTPASLSLVDNENSAAFILTSNSSAYHLNLAGCASAFTSSATQTSSNLNVYKFDSGCLGKLASFQINGIIYSATATGATDFTTWAVGDVATFASTVNATDTLRVEVITQLSNPVVASDTVQYQFENLVKTSDHPLSSSSSSNGHALPVEGNAAPSFILTTVTLTGITGGGAGQFIFKLACTSALVGDSCLGVDMNNLHYQLIEDTFSSTMTYTQAKTAMASGTTPYAAEHKVTTGNGGFTTPALTGPATIYAKPNMILLIGVSNGGAPISFLYFNVDTTVINSN